MKAIKILLLIHCLSISAVCHCGHCHDDKCQNTMIKNVDKHSDVKLLIFKKNTNIFDIKAMTANCYKNIRKKKQFKNYCYIAIVVFCFMIDIIFGKIYKLSRRFCCLFYNRNKYNNMQKNN